MENYFQYVWVKSYLSFFLLSKELYVFVCAAAVQSTASGKYLLLWEDTATRYMEVCRLYYIYIYIHCIWNWAKKKKHSSAPNKLCFSGVAHCKDDTDETWHAVGSSWRNSACMDCTCSGCCSAYVWQLVAVFEWENHCALMWPLSPVSCNCSYSIPRSFPSDCEKVFDQNACEYRVLKKNDPSVECPIYESVGKWCNQYFKCAPGSSVWLLVFLMLLCLLSRLGTDLCLLVKTQSKK